MRPKAIRFLAQMIFAVCAVLIFDETLAAERAYLYEEDATPQGKRFEGVVVWSVQSNRSRPETLVVRADITIPERGMKVTWLLEHEKQNVGRFVVKVNFESEGPQSWSVARLSNVLPKESESVAGTPLFGRTSRLSERAFAISWSTELMGRNFDLLRERPWSDISFVYSDGKRAVLAVEKGKSGERALQGMFDQLPRDLRGFMPMTFFLAEGQPNSCGRGCAEWIAADGEFIESTPSHFRDFLAGLGREPPAIFFNSPGGSGPAAIAVGRFLREKKMKAAVARTIPLSCSLAEEWCRNQIRMAGRSKARLQIDASCHSACVFAFVGASVRQVGPNATVGVHAARWPGMEDTMHLYYRKQREYMIEMGVQPAIVDLAVSIPSERIRILTQAELVRFGVVTKGH